MDLLGMIKKEKRTTLANNEDIVIIIEIANRYIQRIGIFVYYFATIWEIVRISRKIYSWLICFCENCKLYALPCQVIVNP